MDTRCLTSNNMEQRFDLEERAAATILERGVRIPFRAPLFFRMLGKKEVGIVMKPAPLGKLIAISREFTSMGVEVEMLDEMTSNQLNNFVIEHTDSIIRIVGIMLVGKSKLLALVCWWLRRTLTCRKLLDVVKLTIAINGVESFMSSIVLLGRMRMTQPRTSPQDQGSQEA